MDLASAKKNVATTMLHRIEALREQVDKGPGVEPREELEATNSRMSIYLSKLQQLQTCIEIADRIEESLIKEARNLERQKAIEGMEEIRKSRRGLDGKAY